MDKSKFFIAIGPPKTGTTWLYHNLKKHTKVALPRDKEIRYFWAKEFLGKNNFITNLFGNNWHFLSKRKKFKNAIKQHIKNLFLLRGISIADIKWDFKYFFGTQTDSWYENLFTNKSLSGDITPKYSELSEKSLKNIKSLIPNCKIIISLRDPIDREWSRVKMNLLKKKKRAKITEVSDTEVLNHINDKLQYSSNNYAELIAVWEKHFSKNNVFVFYYEELQENPQELLDRICDFLTIPREQIPDIATKRNTGITEPIPTVYLNELVRLNYPFIEKLNSQYPNQHTEKWLQKYKIANFN